MGHLALLCFLSSNPFEKLKMMELPVAESAPPLSFFAGSSFMPNSRSFEVVSGLRFRGPFHVKG
jgi:hypothetical protein